MSSFDFAAALFVGVPWLAYVVTVGVLLLNRAPGHDLPLLPWFPSWDPDAYDEVGQRWLKWHKRAAVLAFVGLVGFAIFVWAVR